MGTLYSFPLITIVIAKWDASNRTSIRNAFILLPIPRRFSLAGDNLIWTDQRKLNSYVCFHALSRIQLRQSPLKNSLVDYEYSFNVAHIVLGLRKAVYN